MMNKLDVTALVVFSGNQLAQAVVLWSTLLNLETLQIYNYMLQPFYFIKNSKKSNIKDN